MEKLSIENLTVVKNFSVENLVLIKKIFYGISYSNRKIVYKK